MRQGVSVNALVDQMCTGAQHPVARLISMVDREDPAVPAIMQRINPRLRHAYSTGITAPPGGCKSILLDRLTSPLPPKGLAVIIVPSDPTSPFSGGAILGVRIRVQQLYPD